MRNRILLAVALAVLLPVAGSAQRAAEWRDSARRLETTMHSLRDSMLQGDSTAAEVARHGNLVIAASANERVDALDALDRFASARDRRYGGAMPSDDGFRIVIRTAPWMDRSRGSTTEQGAVVLSGRPDTGASVRLQTSAAASGVAKALIDRYGEMMIASVPDLSHWMESPPPLSMDETERRDQAMYAFVTATGAIQRRCVGGGLQACRVAMNLRHIEGPENGGRYSPFVRTDLLYFALDVGGAGAWQRLRSTTDTSVEARLAAAAQMPLDSLLSRWRNSLFALRPATSVITARSALIALTWTAMLLLGALGASKWA